MNQENSFKGGITNLVYLSYGREVEYYRTLFAIFSAVAWYTGSGGAFRIILYTDKPEVFEPYLSDIQIEYYTLTPEILKQMLGKSDYIHRRKIAVVELTANRYPNENLIFLDSDTFFKADTQSLLDRLQAGSSLMHKREFTIANGLSIFASYNEAEEPQAFVNYITTNNITIDHSEEHFGVEEFCWNSGVLGLHNDSYIYLPDVMKTSDILYAHSKWFIIEQLAFSFVLQLKTEVKACDDLIIHYWGKRQKVLIDSLIKAEFEKGSVENLKKKRYCQELTLSWEKKVKNDIIIEQVVICIGAKAWFFAIKKLIQLSLKNPFNFRLYPVIYKEVKSG